jgi:hypothetical protein
MVSSVSCEQLGVVLGRRVGSKGSGGELMIPKTGDCSARYLIETSRRERSVFDWVELLAAESAKLHVCSSIFVQVSIK